MSRLARDALTLRWAGMLLGRNTSGLQCQQNPFHCGAGRPQGL